MSEEMKQDQIDELLDQTSSPEEETPKEEMPEEETPDKAEGDSGPKEEMSEAEADLLAQWEEALKEAKESQGPTTETSAPEAKAPKLEEFTQQKDADEAHPSLDFILDIPLEISVEIGRSKMIINDLLKLSQGSIIELNKMAGEPAEIYVNQRLMARGEIVVVNDRFAVRLTEIVSPQERIRQLGS